MQARIFILAAACCFAVSHAWAQDDQPPPYEKGPVWGFTEIKTKDGHFDDYMKWLDTDFKAQSEGLKQKGFLLDYKIFVVDAPRQNEGNIWIAREYPNMAVFDHSVAEDDAMFKSVEGSRTVANQKQAARGSIRDLLSQVLVREVTLK
jgi:hypothetical protein